LPAGADRQPWADGFESRWDLGSARVPRARSGVSPERFDKHFNFYFGWTRFSARRRKRHAGGVRSPKSKTCRPDGAGEWGGAGGYKDFAPDGAANDAKKRQNVDLGDIISYKSNKTTFLLT
jgi:hypothetical protein